MRNINDIPDLTILHALRRHAYIRARAAHDLFVECTSLRRWAKRMNKQGMDIPCDPSCGSQMGHYDPTPDEIAAQCMAIQSTWTPRERAHRMGVLNYNDAAYSIPECRDPCGGLAYLVEVD